MRARPTDPDAGLLLEHAGFVRALSRSLLADEHEAEDNVQQTWLTALEHPPRHRGNLRAWLATIARNLALRRLRRAGRRARRERKVARPEQVPSGEGLAIRRDLGRKVVDAVMSLEEPYRSTVVLRYFRQMTPLVIARNEGISVETVKTRLRRALSQLRHRLDRAHEGNRATWALALAPIAFAAPAASAGLKTKLAVGAVALCVAGTGYFAWRTTRRSEPLAQRSESAARDPVRATRPATDATPDGTRNPEAGGEVREPGAARNADQAGGGVRRRPGPPPPAGVVLGRVRLADDRLALGSRVRLYRKSGQGHDTETDADGTYRFDGVEGGRYEIAASRAGYAVHRFQFDLGESEGAAFDILLKAGGTLLVRVIGAWGAPETGARIVIRERGSWRPVVLEGITDGQGRWLERHLAPVQYDVRAGAGIERVVTVIPGRTVEVLLEHSCGLTGFVAGPDGEPLASAIVRLVPVELGKEGYRRVQARTDADGRYEVRGLPAGDYTLCIQVTGPEAYLASVGKVRLDPGQVLDRPVRIEGAVLSGRVTRADTGEPLDGRAAQVTARPVKVRKTGGSIMAFADREGRYSFVGLAPGVYEIWIASNLPELGDERRIVDFTAGGRLGGIDFALKPRRLGHLRLRVLEPDGSPATGLAFTLRDGQVSRTLHGKEVGDGVVAFRLEVGTRVVDVAREGFLADPVVVAIAEGKTVERTVELRAHDGS